MKRTKRLKKVERTNLFTFSLPDDVTEQLKKLEKGKKSDVVAQALRDYFVAKEGKSLAVPVEEVIAGGLTKTAILQRVKEKILEEWRAKVTAINDSMEAARSKEDYGLVSIYDKILHDEKTGLYFGSNETKWFKEVTIKEIEACTGLSYTVVYNKVLPHIMAAGYTVVKERVLIK